MTKPQRQKRQRAKKTGADNAPTLKQAAFLAAYAECGSVTQAAKLAGCCRSVHGKWMREDEAYRQRFTEAHAELCDMVEAEIIRRAVHGIDEPVIYKGQLSMTAKPGSRKKVPLTVKKKSDLLVIFLAKALMPDKYRERTDVVHSGQVDGTIRVVREENFYPNDAHARTNHSPAQGAPSPIAGAIVAGAIQDAGLRPALGQDGVGPTGVR